MPLMRAAPMAAKAPDTGPAPSEDFGTQKVTVTSHLNAMYKLK